MNVVWFKRDLRIEDQEALTNAAKLGPVLPLYILEPELWRQPDMSYRHYSFLQDSINDLNNALTVIGQPLIIRVGNAVEVLAAIHKKYTINSLWSHQETWNAWTYERDKAVKYWCKSQHIVWHEPTQNGVIRCLHNRDGWSARWAKQMKKRLLRPPSQLVSINAKTDTLPHFMELGLQKDTSSDLQQGGRAQGLVLLNSFLYERGEGYTKEMSSPVTAYDSCSRLSAHIAFGTLSIREVSQACEQRKLEIQQMPYGTKSKWSSAMRSFSGRLRWHCHFIQKLEDEPSIELENMHSAYKSLRDEAFNENFFNAWKTGQTGYPMIDACMRALTATGWLNFRMRAMLMSFSSYHLWLDWRKPALHLARLFTDYEPGIHYSQVQMQSGTTGINSIRIYNPIKQSFDHDPDGVFIRHWIPELHDMDATYIHMPWQAIQQMNGYPMPIVNEQTARKAAADQIYTLRKNNGTHKKIAQKILDKHGSRKSSPRKRSRKKSIKNDAQGELPL